MKTTTIHKIVFLGLMLFPAILAADWPPGPAPSPRNANYQIWVRLNHETKTLEGREIVSWQNITNQPAPDLQFHLYLNAFKNTASTFMQEASTAFRKKKRQPEDWGHIRLDTLRLSNGLDLTSRIEYIAPDDGNVHDQTVIRVPLPEPVRPGQSLQVEIIFQSKLPKIMKRTGYHRDFFMVAQWFPKIGVFEKGQWNCHQFHYHSEFYADFGIYDVYITLPQKFVVGGVGAPVGEQVNEDGTKTVHFQAADVHDFAWTASPDFVIAEDYFENIQIRLFHLPWHQNTVDWHLSPLKQSLGLLKDWLGEYPYPTLSLVSPPVKALEAGGMEYPTFFTVGTLAFLPGGLRFTEQTTIHEFCHNYWQGMVASNEFEAPWLDEGLTSYTETKLMEAIFGTAANNIDFWGIKLNQRDYHRQAYLSQPATDPIVKAAWQFQPGAYGVCNYSKPALLLLTLENLLGEDVLRTALQTYFRRWKFKHPTTQDFINVLNEVADQNLDWFLEPLLFGTATVDYAIRSIDYHRVKPHQGIGVNELDLLSFEDGDSSQVNEGAKQYHSKIYVERLGEMVLPVELLIHFSDGETVRKQWDGQAKWHLFEYRRPAYAISAQVDPENKILLDTNLFNNSKTVSFQSAGVNRVWLRVLFWVQNALFLMGMAG